MNLHILCRVNEESPPEDVEEAEEDSRLQTWLVIRAEIGCGQRAQEDGSAPCSHSSNEHELATSVFVNVERGPGIAETVAD